MKEAQEQRRIVEVENLSRDFGSRRALRSVSLAVESGRILALLGPNGAGKSTLLRLVSGQIEPTQGDARVFGRRAREFAAVGSSDVAILAERHEPPPWATPRVLLDLQAAATGRFDRPFAERMLAEHSLALDRPYRALSKGERRRLLAALTLATAAPLLLLDEPADGMDTAARRSLYENVRDLATGREAAAIVATHIIHDIERVADDVVILDRGRVLLDASLETLREEVREVELVSETQLADFDGVSFPQEAPRDSRSASPVTLLAAKKEPGAVLAWVRSPEGPEAIRHLLGKSVPLRTVGLEALYLAMTQNLSRNTVPAAAPEDPS
jgi:ABC-2 type transport system ATP-binding protein